MKNSFRIKHGNTAPVFVNGKTSLQPYELGYCDSDEELYLGIPKLDDTIDFKKVGGVVEVGGRNLILDSQFGKVAPTTGVAIETETGTGTLVFTGALATSRTVFLSLSPEVIPLLRNRKMTGSMIGIGISVVKGTTNFFIGAELNITYTDGTHSYFRIDGDSLLTSGLPWKRMENHFQVLDKEITSAVIGLWGRDFTGTVKLKLPKIELGNKATDWCAAPEDIKEQMKDLYQSGRNYFISSQRNITASDGVIYEPFNSECPYGFKVTGDQDQKSLLRISNVIKSRGYWTVSWEMRGSQSAAVGFTVDICASTEQRFVTTSDNSWKRFSFTANVVNDLGFVDFQDFEWRYFFIRNIKIEKSPYPSDWSPAPEDIVQKIQENWIAPTMLNGWVNYPGSWNNTSYMKDNLNFVHIKGLVGEGSISANIFVLPPGYRPLKDHIFTMISNNAIGRVDVKADGSVYVWAPSSNVWLPLDSIYFKAEQ